MSTQRILTSAHPATTQLDALIRQMEVTLGKQHTQSPFTPIFQKHGFSTEVKQAPVEETKEAPKKIQKEANKDDQPKEKVAKQPKQPKGEAKKEAQPAVDPNLPEELQAWQLSDLRVAKIVECTRHPESAKLYIEQIDLGEGRLRTIGSGLQEFIPIEQMTEGLCVVYANLKPRKLADIMSEGMVMCASNAEHTQIEIMRPPEGAKVGERVTLDGSPAGEMSQEYQAVLNPKKKIAEKVLPLLMTNDKNEGMFNGHKLMTSAGPIKSKTLTNSHIS